MPALNGKIPIGEQQPVALPAAFFFDLLPVIDDLAELKVTIFAQAALQQKEGDYRFLRFDEFADDEPLMRGLAVIDDSVPARHLLTIRVGKGGRPRYAADGANRHGRRHATLLYRR